jgi:uncharacterized membrane protein
MSWDVTFTNGYTTGVSIAIMYYAPDTCGAYGYGDWATEGWWNLSPGQSAYVVNTDNRYVGFYAEAADGAQWTGNHGPMYVEQTAFSSCIDVGNDNPETSIVGVRQLDLDINSWWELVP